MTVPACAARAAGDEVETLPREPGCAGRFGRCVPQRRMGLLHGAQLDRDVVKVEVRAVVGDPVVREAREQDLERLGVELAALRPVDPEEPLFDRRDAAAHTQIEAPIGQLVEHADLLDHRQRMLEREDETQHAEADARRAGSHCSQEQPRPRDGAERRSVVLGQQERVEPRRLRRLDHRQALPIELMDLDHAAVIQLVPDSDPQLCAHDPLLVANAPIHKSSGAFVPC